MPLIQGFRYRPEIDGLRALAVLSVVLFHTDFGCSGGYVGVDVFFVISGFLITSLIWKDYENGDFTFAKFWERRARRILPALAVVTLATLIASWFLLLPADFKKLGAATISQVLFAANIHSWVTTDYFASSSDEKPLLHMWSLAVEEQFYFIVPFLLMGMARCAALRSRKAVLSILAIILGLSLIVSIQSMVKSPMAAFYLLPSRAWELLLGSFVAFLPALPSVLNRRLSRELMAMIGLSLILVPVFYYHSSTPFPGLAALPPCLGTALVICANGGVATGSATTIGRLLALSPVVFVGAISYSLYLWHWPLLALAKYQTIGPISLSQRIMLVGAAALLATFTWKFVELPFRNRIFGTSRRSMFIFAGSGMSLLFVCGVLCRQMDGFPQRVSIEQQRLANAAFDASFRNQLTPSNVRRGKLVSIGMPNSNSAPAVLVWGDSHAMHALAAIDLFLKERGLSGKAATHSSTPPILDWNKTGGNGVHVDAGEFNDAVFAYIQRRKIREVILIARWCGYHDKRIKHSGRNEALLKTVQSLVAIGVHPTLVLDIPTQPFNVPKVLAQHFQSMHYVESLCTKPSRLSDPGALDPTLIAELQTAGASVLDPKPLFLDRTAQHYVVQSNGTVLYRDYNHLTTKGAILMLLPFFRDSLRLETSVAKKSAPSQIE
jgi:peptidoglycan/LPS O-acetylase OafA/YrhL